MDSPFFILSTTSEPSGNRILALLNPHCSADLSDELFFQLQPQKKTAIFFFCSLFQSKSRQYFFFPVLHQGSRFFPNFQQSSPSLHQHWLSQVSNTWFNRHTSPAFLHHPIGKLVRDFPLKTSIFPLRKPPVLQLAKEPINRCGHWFRPRIRIQCCWCPFPVRLRCMHFPSLSGDFQGFGGEKGRETKQRAVKIKCKRKRAFFFVLIFLSIDRCYGRELWREWAFADASAASSAASVVSCFWGLGNSNRVGRNLGSINI